MCYYCYSRDIDKRFYGGDFHPRLMEERLDDLNKAMTPKPRTIFVGSMADLFGFWNLENNIPKVFKKIMQNNEKRRALNYPLNIFVFLTKNPAGYLYLQRNVFDCSNFWFGTTLENFGSDENNIKRTKAFSMFMARGVQNTFISLEPLLESLIINDDVIRMMIDVKWLIFGALNIKGKPTPPKGDQNVGGIIEKLWIINPGLFIKDSVRKMEGTYWRKNLRKTVYAMRYVPWKVPVMNSKS